MDRLNGIQATFFGHITMEPELRYARDTNKPYVTLRLAVNTYLGPDRDPETDYINVTMFDQYAERAASCTVGALCFVQGRMSHRNFVRRDGTNGYAIEVRPGTFRSFDRRSSEDPMVSPPAPEEVDQADEEPPPVELDDEADDQ